MEIIIDYKDSIYISDIYIRIISNGVEQYGIEVFQIHSRFWLVSIDWPDQ